MNARQREIAAAKTRERQEADRIRARHARDPWAKAPIVPISTVLAWLDVIYEMTEKDYSVPTGWESVANLIGIDSRIIRRLRKQTASGVTVDLAEVIAEVAGRMDEFREVTEPGKEGWSRRARYCQRCGRSDVPHHAKDLCFRCYQTTWHHTHRMGKDAPPLPAEERHSKSHGSGRRPENILGRVPRSR